MATLFGEHVDDHGGKSSIVDDFMYGSNVASSHVYVRLGFLRKVYGILSTQLLFTTLVGAAFVMYEPLGQFVKAHDSLVIILAVLSIGLVIGMSVMRNVVPHNYILLSLFTVCEALLVGFVVTLRRDVGDRSICSDVRGHSWTDDVHLSD